jgi:hypothetical protein
MNWAHHWKRVAKKQRARLQFAHELIDSLYRAFKAEQDHHLREEILKAEVFYFLDKLSRTEETLTIRTELVNAQEQTISELRAALDAYHWYDHD